MPPFARHVFVCGNARVADHPRGSCDPTGGGALHTVFKQAVAALGLQRTVRANKAGCLDQCEHGPTVVVYPEGVWYGHVTTEDVAVIVEQHLLRGEPVERLRLTDGCVNTSTCAHKPRRPALS